MPTEGITKQYHRVEQETLSRLYNRCFSWRTVHACLSQRETSLSSSSSQWQASNSHRIVDCSPHFGHFQSGPVHPQISQIAQTIFLERRFPQSAIRNPQFSDL